MMENSPDPGETEEEDEEEGSHCSSRDNPSLLEEIRQLSQASNNNCSYEGTARNWEVGKSGAGLISDTKIKDIQFTTPQIPRLNVQCVIFSFDF